MPDWFERFRSQVMQTGSYLGRADRIMLIGLISRRRLVACGIGKHFEEPRTIHGSSQYDPRFRNDGG